MRHMPAIPESTRDSITWRLILHAEKNWPQLDKVQVTYRSSFAYVAGVLPGGEQIPLCRLRYGGSAHSFGFAIYSAARERYEDSLLRTGLPTGTPQEALDTACTVHLTGLGHEPGDQPPTNLRPGPLSAGACPARTSRCLCGENPSVSPGCGARFRTTSRRAAVTCSAEASSGTSRCGSTLVNHEPGPNTTHSASSTARTASGTAGGSGGSSVIDRT